MAGLAQRHEIALVMGAARRQRNDVVYLRSRRHPAFAPAHFAQGMRGNKPAPNGWPRAVVPLLHFRRSAVAIVPGRDQLLVRRAVLPVRQLRAAGIAAGVLGFSWHSRPPRIQKALAGSLREGRSASFDSTIIARPNVTPRTLGLFHCLFFVMEICL